MNYLPLIGIAWVVAGFALRVNPALTVVSAGLITGLAAGKSIFEVLVLLGDAFSKNRYLALLLLTLPVIGLLEKHGLKEHAQTWVSRMKAATSGRILIGYLLLRQCAASLGLTSLGGHPQTVRPLLVPLAEGAAEARFGKLPKPVQQRLRAMCAATDNVGLFFGEDIFIAFAAVLLMQAFLAENGFTFEPLQIAIWGIPTAICAFIIHGTRLSRLDRQIKQDIAALKAREPRP